MKDSIASEHANTWLHRAERVQHEATAGREHRQKHKCNTSAHNEHDLSIGTVAQL